MGPFLYLFLLIHGQQLDKVSYRQKLIGFATYCCKKGASFGSSATLLCGITIGENAIVGVGSVVTKDVRPNIIVAGNPARILRKTSVVDCKKRMKLSGRETSHVMRAGIFVSPEAFHPNE